MTIKQINDSLYMLSKIDDQNIGMEYFNNHHKRHFENGPAIISMDKNNKQANYLEWWKDGNLVATFDKKTGKMKKTNNDTFTGLYDVEIPEKWKGLESTLNLFDLQFCNRPIPIYHGNPPALAATQVAPQPLEISTVKNNNIEKETSYSDGIGFKQTNSINPALEDVQIINYLYNPDSKIKQINEVVEKIRKSSMAQPLKSKNNHRPE